MRIGMLTSGGDAPGMNAAIVGAAVRARAEGHELVLLADGYDGLIDQHATQLRQDDLRTIVNVSGTVIRTARCPRMREPGGAAGAARSARQLGLDAVIVLGGAGSLAGAATLAQLGVTVVGVPATIDLDMRYDTDTLGADSALNYAARAIDDLRTTATSLPGRAFLVETLGGDSGHLARAVGRLAGAPIVLTPEQPWEPIDVAQRMKEEVQAGYTIVVMGEGVGTAAEVCRRLETHYGDRIRPTTLGHSMRGAPVSAVDRLLGLAAGESALDVAAEERSAALVLRGTRVARTVPFGAPPLPAT